MPDSSRYFLLVMVLVSLVSIPVLNAHEGPEPGQAAYFQVTRLAPDLLLLSTDQGSYSNNSLVFTGPDGVLLVDTHHDNDAEAFKDFIDGLGFGSPRYIITTHRHVEHIGGNALFGADPIIIGHHLLPEKLRSGTYLFNEYPPEAFPDITFEESMEIRFNGETIRLKDIGGSHDDNEIMVHFVEHGVAHISSVVNGFNFPSVDSDGSVLEFETVTRRLMSLLPEGTRLVSGHHGKARGFDFVGSWEMLEPYAEAMKGSVEIVRAALAEGRTAHEMQESGILDAYQDYAGSYVDTDDWIESVVDALTEPREERADICRPLFESWKSEGAAAAVARYKMLLQTDEQLYDFNEFVLLNVGAKLQARGLYEDAVEFLLASIDLYPEAKYSYYTHYLAAKSLVALSQNERAASHCRRAIELEADFAAAASLLATLEP